MSETAQTTAPHTDAPAATPSGAPDRPEPTSRDERRRRTEATILDAARQLFAESGFERATIRAVAARAGVDPALVMQHFGNKAGLFAAAARWTSTHETVLSADRADVPAAALSDLFRKFEDVDDREGAEALMRNCLTHPEAARIMRDEVICERSSRVAEVLGGGPDAELQAGLMGACMMGIGVARYLLEVPAVARASHEDIARLMEPALRALLEPPAPATGDGAAADAVDRVDPAAGAGGTGGGRS